MLIPIRCFSCGKPIGHLWDEYQNAVRAGRNKKNTLDKIGLDRYCCRSIFLTHIDLTQKVGVFKK